jgi:anaerobic ribonucleoside-triphosphate reductase activating protein
MRYAKIVDESIVDGPGLRIVVFLQGCLRNCPGCHNPELRPLDKGEEISENRLINSITARLTPLHRGVTFTGGDPLLQPYSLHEVITQVKQAAQHLTIWVYTGYKYETVKHMPIMKLIDVLIDGPYIEAQRDLSLAFRGSSNQRLIDVPKTRATGEVILWQESV